MKSSNINRIMVACMFLTAASAFAAIVPVLDSAQDYAVLGATTVTNTGSTTVAGDVGLYPGPSITGFDTESNTVVNGPGSTGLVDGAGLVDGTIHISSADAQQAQTDLTKAYTALSDLPVTDDLTGEDLGNYNNSNLGALAPGVYNFDSSVAITGHLELDAQNTDGVYWVFQIGSTLTAASSSVVQLINPNVAGNNGSDIGVFWVVGSSATLGTSSTMEGNILAQADITMNTSAQILNGRALARTGQVTMDTNTISNICPDNNNGPGFSGGLVFASADSNELIPLAAIPEPGTLGLLALGLLTLVGQRRQSRADGWAANNR